MREGRVLRIVARPIAPMRKAADAGSGLVTEALLGERVQVEETGCGACQGGARGGRLYRLSAGGGAGGPGGAAPSHRIIVPKAFRFSAPDIKSSVLGGLYLNCRVAVSDHDGDERFGRLDGGGFVLRAMTAPLARVAGDPGMVAEQFLGVPYLWGGKSYEGLDCSGLVQLALQASGIAAPRDSHMIEAAVGRPVEGAGEASLRRGDLVFWKGMSG